MENLPAQKVSFTQLTHTVVRRAQGPLTADEIQAAVAALAPITTQNPQGTIRNAICQSILNEDLPPESACLFPE